MARPMKKRRLLLLLLVGALLIGGGWLYRQRWLPKPVGEGPAGPAVAREAFAETWTDRQVLLLGIGDSITAGFGVPRTHSYFGRLAKNPDDEFDDMQGICLSAVLPNLEVENIAISGSTSLHHLQHVRPTDWRSIGRITRSFIVVRPSGHPFIWSASTTNSSATESIVHSPAASTTGRRTRIIGMPRT